MANSDYVVSGQQGQITPFGRLVSALTEESPAITITLFQPTQPTGDLEVGMGVLIDGEILRLESIELPTLTVLRGCADTIPARHLANSPVWFFSNTAEGDGVEHTATSTVGVKILPFSLSDGPVPVSKAPPLNVTFNWRFSRPYAPGLMLCQGLPWYHDTFAFEDDDTEYAFTWKHRDRILQADQLVGHNAETIGPEPGTSYTARVYNADNTLVRTVAGITGEAWAYSRSLAEVDVPSGTGRVEIRAVRGGLESWSTYVTRIRPGGGGGFGETFGLNFGG